MATLVVNTHQAKSRLSELIREALAGVDVIVARNGEPVVRIVAWTPDRAARVPGIWVSQVRGSDQCVTSDEELVEMFAASAGDASR